MTHQQQYYFSTSPDDHKSLWSRKPQSLTLGIDLIMSLQDVFTLIIVILIKLYVYSKLSILHSQDSKGLY